MEKVFLSLGANLGDRRASIQKAIDLLGTAEAAPAILKNLRAASLYETEPVGVFEEKNPPWFLNTVVEGETELSPADLLAQLQKIEQQLGRAPDTQKKDGAFESRLIDIDILFYGNQIIEIPATAQTQPLIIPHPRLHERLFVLRPLVELAPHLHHPVLKKTVQELFKDCAEAAQPL